MVVASTEALDALKSIGLNLYERKIFTALLAKGVATAAEVSELAKVPRSRSYDVLESLSEKGFVMVQPSKPIKYVVLEPSEALDRTKDIMKKNHDETIERINKLQKSPILDELNGIFTKGMNLVQPTQMTGTIKGRHLIDRQLNSIFKKASSEINIVTTKKGLEDLQLNHMRTLKKASKNGVKVKIAAPFDKNSDMKELSAIAEIKNVASPTGRVFVVDNDYVLMGLADDKDTHESQDIAFWANSGHAVKTIAKPVFSRYWNGK
ncbi:MAG: helix-turn-helix domain-containing protein [Nanoarchaeota archaeon]